MNMFWISNIKNAPRLEVEGRQSFIAVVDYATVPPLFPVIIQPAAPAS